jgi:uncharacterized protein (DUF427 family)
MKLPGPDHPIIIAPHRGHVRVICNGAVVANSTSALCMKETTHAPVFYIPRDDAQMALFERTTHGTHCSYKGHASYYSINAGGKISENAIWSYEEPYPAMAEIAGRLAFYPSRVDAIEVTE